jgi:hypothetical protein
MPSLGPPVSSPGGKRRDDTLLPLETAPGDSLPGLGVQRICSPETLEGDTGISCLILAPAPSRHTPTNVPTS